MPKTKVFVSFDFDNDQTLKHFIVGQAKLPDSPFEITDMSLKEAAPQWDWEARARAAINRSDVVVVMLGPKSRFAPGVKKEVAMANAAGKRRFQVIGYSDGTIDWAVPDAGKVYNWNWETLKKLLGPQ